MNHHDTREQIASTEFDREQQWRAEFELQWWLKSTVMHWRMVTRMMDGEYVDPEAELAWQAFLKAKRG